LRKAASRPSALSGRHQDKVKFRDWFLVELGLESGLRVSEMASLRCSDFLLSESRPAVRVRRGKGGKPRVVEISETFAEECRAFLRWKQRHGQGVAPEAFVFCGKTPGKPISVRALQRAFKRAAQDAGLPGYYSIHSLRHTYGTSLYEVSGGDIRLVQEQLGHSRVSTTEVYAHVTSRRRTESLEQLSDAYRSTKETS